ncbi:hypothetical protein JTB14_009908 [Gonioctena quinquepunctata]|nr:hypothetical protein JTB14_009908 [Gonioctena quinquepunctata]
MWKIPFSFKFLCDFRPFFNSVWHLGTESNQHKTQENNICMEIDDILIRHLLKAVNFLLLRRPDPLEAPKYLRKKPIKFQRKLLNEWNNLSRPRLKIPSNLMMHLGSIPPKNSDICRHQWPLSARNLLMRQFSYLNLNIEIPHPKFVTENYTPPPTWRLPPPSISTAHDPVMTAYLDAVGSIHNMQ